MSSPPITGSWGIPSVLVLVASTLVLVGIELGLVAVLTAAPYALSSWLIRRALVIRPAAEESLRALQRHLRRILIGVALVLGLGVLGFNGWLALGGIDPQARTLALLASISAEMLMASAFAFGKLVAGAIGLRIGARILRVALDRFEALLNRWDQVRANDQSLRILFAGIYRAVMITAWMLLAIFACHVVAAPAIFVASLLRLVRAYLVIAVGLLVVRSSVAIVDTLDGLSARYAQSRGWLQYYENLRPLVPTFRACFEYGLWVTIGSLVLIQLGAESFAGWGPRLIQAIGIFFLSRVAIELGRLEIDRRLLHQERLDEMTRRRRETIAPLVRTAFTYAVYFGSVVLMLASLGFNPLPFLAGAGILGLVIGFGAQSLINDVVSGFFTLFENTYLLGDSIEAAGAHGVVEAIEFRTTKIRDADGRLHIIRNGDVKEVVNYSKEYTLAVVPLDVSYDADLRAVFSVLREAGDRLRAENTDVLADTQVEGIVAFGPTTMTVRTATRVRPGRHRAAAADLRLAIKEAFDLRADGAGRRGLVPTGLGAPTVPERQDSLRDGAAVEHRVGPVGDLVSGPGTSEDPFHAGRR